MRVLAFHKPFGVLSQFTDAAGTGHGTLKQYIDVPDVYPIGRLDRDSEGLLLLTDDGALQHRLSHPRFDHPKTYWVQVEGQPTAADLEPLLRGLRIQDYTTRPALARLLDEEPAVPPRDPPIRYRAAIPTAWVEIKLTEGRNRQVRRMTAAIGFPTLRLLRVAHGPVRLEPLAPGEHRWLSPKDVAGLVGQRHAK
jgi:23S rRNA pseudouridine2457 synthase